MKTIKLFIIGLIFIFSGCTEEYLEPYRANPDQLNIESFWLNPENARGVLVRAYSTIQNDALYGRKFFPMYVLMAHDADLDYLSQPFWNEFATNNVNPSNERIESTFEAWYDAISSVNDFIQNYDRIEPTEAINQDQIDDLLGQAYFLRGFSYFHLANTWSEALPAENSQALGVPLMLTVVDSEDEFYPSRATVSEVYKQIEADFKKSIELLPMGVRTADTKGMIEYYAAVSYLGKTYLFQEKYQEAKTEFEKVINSGEYSLVDSIYKNFDGNHEFNTESIQEWNYSNASNAVGSGAFSGTFNEFPVLHGPVELGRGIFANFMVNDETVARFGDDPRKEATLLLRGDRVLATEGGLYLPVRKWVTTQKFIPVDRWEIKNPGFTSNISIVRLADIYLLYAETLSALGQDQLAAEYMNKVRRRAYYAPVDVPNDTVDYAVTGMALRDSIREERWRELHYEGHRWYDIRRWKILEQELAKATTRAGTIVFDPRDYIMPIPSRDVMINPNMVQSIGYR